jgi:hypothetical protein
MTIASKILTTVNAPFGVKASAWSLAKSIADMKSVEDCDGPTFTFFSDVNPELQKAFIAEMSVDADKVANVAAGFSKLAGYNLPLAA